MPWKENRLGVRKATSLVSEHDHTGNISREHFRISMRMFHFVCLQFCELGEGGWKGGRTKANSVCFTKKCG